MVLIMNTILSAFYLILIGIDILSFFVLAHLLSYKWHYQWLQAFDAIGKPLAEWYSDATQNVINRLTHKVNSKQALLAWGLLFLSIIRLILTGFFNAVVQSTTLMNR